MNYSGFREDMIIALYQEQVHEGEDEMIAFRKLAETYDLEWREGWLGELQKELRSEGLIRGPSNGIGDDMAIGKLAGPGLRYVEDKYGSKDGVATILSKPEYDNLIVPVEDQREAEESENSVESSAWTGLPSDFVLSESKRGSLVAMLASAENALDAVGAGNSEKAMARAYIVAARTLADVPDPPVDLIWEIIGRANSIAGIASLLVSIIALFSVAAH